MAIVRTAPHGPRRALTAGAVFGLAYLALNEVGVRLAVPPAGFSVFWPAAGLALAVFLGSPRSWWPSLAVGLAVANLFGNLVHGTPLRVTVWFVVANLIESMAGAWFVDSWRVRLRSGGFVPQRFAAPVLGIVAATAGAAVIAATGLVWVADVGGGFGNAWRTWWVADSMGILSVAPILVFRSEFGRLARPSGWTEGVLALGSTWAVTAVIFAAASHRTTPQSIVYLVVPALLWPALRLGRAVTGSAFCGAVVIAVWFTKNGNGPFADSLKESVDNALDVQLFLSVLGASMLAVSFVVELTRRAERTAWMVASERAERDRLQTVLDETAVLARERAELLEAATLLAEVSEVLDEAMTVDEQLRRLANVLSSRLDAWCGIDLLSSDASGHVLTPAAQAGPVIYGAHVRAMRSDDPRRSVIAGEPLLVQAVELQPGRSAHWSQEIPEDVLDSRPASIVVAPITNGGSVFGLLNLMRYQSQEPFDARDLGLALDVGRRAGQAVRNATLFEREREISRRLQASLLPDSLPNHPAVQLAARYRPGEEGLDVGGDWYDAFLLGPDRLGVAVGDVVGGGLEAASATGQLRSAVRALAGRCSGPADVLAELDTFVAAVPGAEVATLVYVELELSTGVFRYACAGHPPPLVVAGDASTRFLEGGRSTPFLTVASPRRVEAVGVLDEGDTLLLFTDGLFERRGETLDAGLSRLAGAAVGVGTQTLDRAVDGLVEELLGGRGVSDDVCLLAVSRPRLDPERFRRVFAADPTELAPARARLRDWLGLNGIGQPVVDDILLATFEAAANAVEHAYHGRRTGTATIDARFEGHDLVVEVHDHGTWRSPAAPGERGRGTGLMRAVMDSATVTRTSAGTRVELRRRLSAG